MIQGYATKRKTRSGIWRYAIGKVFGKLHPNLELGNVFLNRAVAGSGGFDRLGLRLGDLGDAGARPSKARVFLSRGPRRQASGRRAGGDIVLKTIRVPRIASGRLKTLKLKLRIPTGERFRRYRFLGIKLDVKRRIREYDEHDNTLLVPLR